VQVKGQTGKMTVLLIAFCGNCQMRQVSVFPFVEKKKWCYNIMVTKTPHALMHTREDPD